ncbi:MAG: tRNA threonylcarbamoyladenosine dehydratase [Solobacterium sp.]|nr:tRNA threonylcarbamoyladenosine dehydratase [Solobacterium sp.]
MSEAFIRTARVMGIRAMEKIRASRIAVFGVGGVGGNCAEALARSGVGALDLIDNDSVAVSNLNRQVFAVYSTVGMRKVEAAKLRLLDINPDLKINPVDLFYLPEESGKIDFSEFDYIVDAIDTVTAKLDIIERAIRCGTPVISSMGCGNRTDPSKLKICDVYETSGDPLAKVMRRELRKRGIRRLTVCCSEEAPAVPLNYAEADADQHRRSIPGSTAFVPPAAGILIASYVIRQLVQYDPADRE